MRDETGAVARGPTFGLPQLSRYFSELSPQPMVAVEGTTHLVRHFNEAFARLVGKNRTELLGRSFAEAVPEGDNNGCLALLNRVYHTGTPENLIEQQHGQTPPAYWSYVVWAILGLDDCPAGVIIQVTDVTETAIFRRQVTEMNQALVLSSVRQHELTEAAEASEVEYRRLCEISQEQAAALADMDHRKDEFLAMLGHELRNPLAPILNAALLLRMHSNSNRQQGIEDPVLHQSVNIIERQVRQLAHLIDDLLEVSRITTGRIQLHLERIAAAGVITNSVATVRLLIDQRKHELTVSLPTEAIWLDADAARLEQVVVNLLTNAAKYTDAGGHIWVTLQQEDNAAVLRVRDTGLGIAAEILPRIFDLFTQAERTLDRSQGGLGIGLALVQRLVELQGGTVEASSVLGQGSEFVVRLPIADSRLPMEAKADDGNRKSAIENQKSLRVLVVDDSVDAAKMCSMLLRAWGHETRIAHNGPDALERATGFHPHVILCDIGLPNMDGYEVARHIRQNPHLEGVMLVAVTGYGQDSDRQRSKEAGFDLHMVKPVESADLKALLADFHPPNPSP
jgi:signal transduction histidine kinase/CheY-like chemotaxis protein